MSGLRIGLLQSVLITLDGRAISFRSRKSKALLAYLAAEPGRPHTRSALAGLLWSDRSQPAALHNLSQTLLYLRQALGEPAGRLLRLVVNVQTIQLRLIEGDWVDTAAFAAHLAEANSAPHADVAHAGCATCIAALERAVALCQGPFLADLVLTDSDLFEDWALIRREQIQRELIRALERLAASYESRGEYGRAEDAARRIVALDPLHESAYRALMRALAIRGESGAALALYDGYRRRLSADLAIEPAGETVALAAQIRGSRPVAISEQISGRRLSAIPHPGAVYGRDDELARLVSWLDDPACRVVALHGIGGIGKTTLAALLCERVDDRFEAILWRSLLNAPPLNEVLCGWLEALDAAPPLALPDDTETQLDLLLNILGSRRCLLVLDNLESVLKTGQSAGAFRPGYAGYGQLLARLGQGRHQSCLLLTGRELAIELARLERAGVGVRSLKLAGLSAQAAKDILQERGLDGPNDAAPVLAARYSGNPLALRLVADAIRELFGGDVAAFVGDQTLIFSDVRDVLDQQIARTAPLERAILTWLAVEREPVALKRLHDNLAGNVRRGDLTEAAQSLLRRSLIEAHDAGVGLQNVVLEYLTDRLVAAAVGELETGALDELHRYALMRPKAKEYIRQSQERLIIHPIAEQLAAHRGAAGAVAALRAALDELRRKAAPGYAAGNLLNLLVYLGADLRGVDCAGLSIWSADLRGVALPEANFAGADLRGTTFTDAFRAVPAVAFSPDGRLLAVGTGDGDVRLWRPDGQLVHICAGHSGLVWSLSFSPNGETLASAAMDQTVRLWDVGSGALLRTLVGPQAGLVAVAFSPDGAQVAASGFDPAIYLWDAWSGKLAGTLPGHIGATLGLAYHPDGTTLASGGLDNLVSLWDRATSRLARSFAGHTAGVLRVAYSPDGATIASASHDRTLGLWDANTGRLLHTLCGHSDVVAAVAFSPDGATLASGAWDRCVFLWEVATGTRSATLQGHSTHVGGVAFSPDGATIASGGFDQTVRLWERWSGRLLTILRGHTSWVWSVAFSPDGTLLASAHQDGTVCLWDVRGHALHENWRAIAGGVSAVAFSPDGALAAGGRDGVVREWTLRGGRSGRELSAHGASLSALCYSPDGALLCSTSFDGEVRLTERRTGRWKRLAHGQAHSALPAVFSPDSGSLVFPGDDNALQIWDARTRTQTLVLRGHQQTVLALAYCADGSSLASSAQDGAVRIWDGTLGEVRHALGGHSRWVYTLAFSPDGATLAGGSDDGAIYLWDARAGTLRSTLRGHSGWVFALAFSPDGATLASGSDDGTIRLWDVPSGVCRHTLIPPPPYDRMQIAGATGLSRAQQTALAALGAGGSRHNESADKVADGLIIGGSVA